MTFVSELRHAARLLRRMPAVTLTAMAVLALGIAANTTVFSVVETVLLKPLPYHDAARLVIVNEVRTSRSALISVSYDDYRDWRDQTRDVFDEIAARNTETFNLTGMGGPEQVAGSNVSSALFAVLGVGPALGRVFTADDDRPGAAPVVVITARAWHTRWGSRPDVVGQRITLDGVPRTVIGVLPDGFRYPITDTRGEIFAPLGQIRNDLGDRGSHPGISVIARLREGVPLERARAALETVATRLARQYPDTNRDIAVRADLYQDRVVGPSRPLLVALWGAVAALLVIACANVAGLLLARGAARTQEFAIRLALGAGRLRLIRQLLAESLTLAAVGSAAGLALSIWALPIVVRLLPRDLPRLDEIAVDGRLLAFAGAAAALTGLACGVLPGWQAGRTPLYAATKTADGYLARRPRLRAALVVGQLALTEALIVGGALLAMSLVHLLERSPGFEPAHAMAAQYYLPDAVYTTHDQLVAFHEEALRRVRALHGVESAALITPLPFGFGDRQDEYEVDGHPVGGPVDLARADAFMASPDAPAALGIPVRSGRFFDDRDRRDSLRVAVVDDRFERAYFPGGAAIGRRIRPARSATWLTIVGVVGHVDARSLTEPGRVQVYTPLFATSLHFASLVVRTSADPPLSLLPAIRVEFGRMDGNLPLFNTTSLSALVAESTSQARTGAILFGLFALLAWGLAAIGLSGLIAYTVTVRRRELGIRLALGAPPAGLVRGIVADGARLTLLGLGAGLALAAGLARALDALLVDLKPLDPATFAAACVALAATGLLAAYVPARAASRVDPLQALRAE